MPRLQAANGAVTTLAQAINDSQTSFMVVDASSFPLPPFKLVIDDREIVEVEAVSGNEFSVVQRGDGGTDAIAHAAGTEVANKFTADAHMELLDQTDIAAQKGAADGLTSLDSSGNVPATQLGNVPPPPPVPVDSVFGRTGAVTAQAGDYTAGQVGADPAGSAAAVQSDLDTHASNPNAHKGQKNSIELDSGDLQLVGDEASPGENKVYGTDENGNKGWHDAPSPVLIVEELPAL